MINNRQAGRRRGRGGNNGAGGGNNGGNGGTNPRQGNTSRGDGGNRIDSRARGNAAQMLEKYKNLARDAQLSGDRVNIESYLQFADHYFRVLTEQRSRFEENQPRRQSSESFDDGYDGESDGDDDFGQEGEPIRAREQLAPMRGNEQNAQQRDGNRNDGQRNDGQRYEPRGDGPRDNVSRNDGQQRGDGQYRDVPPRDSQRSQSEQPQRSAQRSERKPYVEGERRPRRERNEAQDAQPGELAPTDSPPAMRAPDPVVAPSVEAQVEAPRRRPGRPRREPVAAPVEEAATFEADRLPPSLGLTAVVSGSDEPEAPKPRRRRIARAEGPAAE